MASQSSETSISTDSYPSNYKSVSSKQQTSSSSGSEAEKRCTSSSDSIPDSTSTLFTAVRKCPKYRKWNRAAHETGRPYERLDFDTPFKPLPGYFRQVGGLGIPARDPSLPPGVNPFHRRTVVDEIHHKRVTGANVYSITEEPKQVSGVFPKGEEEKKLPLEIVRDIVLADNMDSDVEDAGAPESDESEDLSSVSWDASELRPAKDEVLRECKRDFFRARKQLFKMRQYESYLEDKYRIPDKVESWIISSESSIVSDDGSEQIPIEQEVEPESFTWTDDDFKPTEIVREKDKEPVVEHQHQHLEQIREYLWEEYARKERKAQRQPIIPEPLEVWEILRDLPKQDYLNREKQQFRQYLVERLDAMLECQRVVPKNLPQTRAEFEKFNNEIMRERRELVDEAIVMERYYQRVGLDVTLPEKDLPLRQYRAVDYKSDESEEELEDLDSEETLVKPVHTCMTRLEWSHWLGPRRVQSKLTFVDVHQRQSK
ncbi:uncharacterized protein LOC129763070 [Toxorhynchites rutilus septentrionalis]|uniref:uncharacterized protein LOC129763070 n=1 Tax=Toxorhynchites rutilus septentrionalis TaxID=329112 RepID=UPI002478A238|nr:uncharacterized protein LOC129763070 [Toxorhynchites rutilus septentrionalis]